MTPHRYAPDRRPGRRRRVAAAVVVAALALVGAACSNGGDGDAAPPDGADTATDTATVGADGLTGPQQQVYDTLVEGLAAEGIDADLGCVRDVIATLDSDLAARAAEGSGMPDPEILAEFQRVDASAQRCLSPASQAALFADAMETQGLDVDRGCVEEAFTSRDPAVVEQLVASVGSSGSSPQARALYDDALGCVERSSLAALVARQWEAEEDTTLDRGCVTAVLEDPDGARQVSELFLAGTVPDGLAERIEACVAP